MLVRGLRAILSAVPSRAREYRFVRVALTLIFLGGTGCVGFVLGANLTAQGSAPCTTMCVLTKASPPLGTRAFTGAC
jgi:hypothetical protein